MAFTKLSFPITVENFHQLWGTPTTYQRVQHAVGFVSHILRQKDYTGDDIKGALSTFLANLKEELARTECPEKIALLGFRKLLCRDMICAVDVIMGKNLSSLPPEALSTSGVS